jgi:hypothetical protein
VRRIHRQDDGHMWAVVTQRVNCGGASPWRDVHANHMLGARPLRGRKRCPVSSLALVRQRCGQLV